MFGQQLNEETLSQLSNILSMDREKIEQTTINKLRIELEYLYDITKDTIFDKGLKLKINEMDIELFNNVQETYNTFMQNYEELMD